MSNIFQQILQQVEQNNITAARNMIKAYLKENPTKEQGWVVAFNIFHKKENKIYCLEQILALNPTNIKAKSLLHKLHNPTTYSTSIQTQPKPVLRKSTEDFFSKQVAIEQEYTPPQTKNEEDVKTANSQSQKQGIINDVPLKNVVNSQPVEDLPRKEVVSIKQTPLSKEQPISPIKKVQAIDNPKQSTPTKTATKKIIRRVITRPVSVEKISTTIKKPKNIPEFPTQLTKEKQQVIPQKSKITKEEVTAAERSHEDMCIVLSNAVEKKDIALIQLLFQDEAEKIEMQLEEVLMRKLVFKSPPTPQLSAKQRATFDSVKNLAATNDPANIKKATTFLQDIWVENIENLGLRSWMAFLQIKQGNLSQGVQLLRSVLRLKEPKFSAFALWNLAVIAAKTKEDKLALQLLVLLLEKNSKPEFLKVAIALAVKVPEAPIFFSLLPKLWHLNYHPLAIYLATNYPKEAYLNTFSEVYIQQTVWNPPSPSYRFEQAQEYKKVISQAIVSRNVPRLIAWLRARIAISKIYVPDYLALSDVLEKDAGDMDAAFEVLLKRLEIRKLNNSQKEVAARDLIELCIRSNRNDLKRAAFQAIQYSYGNREIIYTIEEWESLPEVPKAATSHQVVALSSLIDEDSISKKLTQLVQKLSKTVIVPFVVKKELPKQETQAAKTKNAYALFVDHENIIKSLEQIRQAYGQPQPENPKKQFAQDLQQLLDRVEQRIKAPLTHKVAVSFWNRFPDKDFQPIYASKGFITTQPRAVKKENAVDFHLVEKIHQFWRTTLNEQQNIRQIVILTGDGDFSAIALAAKKEGIGLQVWGGRKSFGDRFRKLLGKDAFVLLEDVLR